MALADVGARHAHVGAERPQVLDLLARHLVGDDEDQPVALERCRPGPGRGRCCRRSPRRWCRRASSRPSFSAASIIDSAMRSLIEPPGFWLSSLTNSRHGPVSNFLSSTTGVWPMRSSTEANAFWRRCMSAAHEVAAGRAASGKPMRSSISFEEERRPRCDRRHNHDTRFAGNGNVPLDPSRRGRSLSSARIGPTLAWDMTSTGKCLARLPNSAIRSRSKMTANDRGSAVPGAPRDGPGWRPSAPGNHALPIRPARALTHVNAERPVLGPNGAVERKEISPLTAASGTFARNADLAM